MQGQFLTQGPMLEAFEFALARTLGAKNAIVCNSGTAALHLAYLALDLGVDRGLLTSPITFLATASAARMCGAPVVFADVDPVMGNLTPDMVKAALSSTKERIAAVTAIHVGGRPCDMPELRKLTNERGLALIEDACHAPLASYRGLNGESHYVGACAHSDIAVFSFHPIKHVAMGEGGAVLTNDVKIAERVRTLRNHGMTRDPRTWVNAPEPDAPWYYEMHEIGWNYRACEMQCALGLSQLARVEDGIHRRRHIAGQYDRLLSGLNHLTPPPPSEGNVWHLYPIAIDFEAVGKTRGQLMTALAARGIETQVHYIPVNRQPYYESLGANATPGADLYYQRTLSIPMYPGLSDVDVKYIADSIRDVLCY